MFSRTRPKSLTTQPEKVKTGSGVPETSAGAGFFRNFLKKVNIFSSCPAVKHRLMPKKMNYRKIIVRLGRNGKEKPQKNPVFGC